MTSTAPAAAPAASPPASPALPLIFVSHKHADSAIADVLSAFVRGRTGGRANVFQSSNFFTQGPRVGRSLSVEIRRAAAEACVVLLVYTHPDEDWNYCMWECGIASDPSTPEAKIVAFQFGASVPELFADQVHVNARNVLDIQKFTNELLTDPAFLPGFPTALTALASQGPEVREAATDLFAKLQPVLPSADPDASWTACPYIRFDLDLSSAALVAAAMSEGKTDDARALLLAKCTISEHARAADQLFGVTEFTDVTLQGLSRMAQEQHPGEGQEWFDSLVDQLVAAATSRLPTLELRGLADRSSTGLYAPVLTGWQRRSNTRCTQFNVYFVPFGKAPAAADPPPSATGSH